MASVKRRIFHRAIGEKLAKLRVGKDLTQGQVEHLSRGVVNKNTLKSIEAGRIEHPNPGVLRELARLYKVPYAEIASPFVEATYGRDLARHVGDQSSGSSSHVGDQTNDSITARLELESLRERIAQYDKEIRKMRTLADDVFQTAIALEQIREAAARTSHRRRHDRKTG